MTGILLAGLAVILVMAIVTGINAGIIAMLFGGLLGTTIADMSAREIAAGFPGDLFIMLFGILLLLSIASQNGSIEWLVQQLIKLVGGRVAVMPWLLFFAALLSSSMGPGAAPLLFVVGAGFARSYGLSPLMVGAMVIHGNQAGFFSPIAPYGILFATLMERAGISIANVDLYLIVVIFHLLLAGIVFLLFGGLRLLRAGNRDSQVENVADETGEVAAINGIQIATLSGFVSLLLGSLFTDVNIGFLALAISLFLLLISGKDESDKAIVAVAWPILLIICGVTLYVHVLQHSGTIDNVAGVLTDLASVEQVALLIAWLAAALTAVASTFGTLGMLLPLSTPFLVAGELDVTSFLALVAISAAVTDISPLSPWGAMFLASCTSMNREVLFRQMLMYTAVMVILVPVIVWTALIIL